MKYRSFLLLYTAILLVELSSRFLRWDYLNLLAKPALLPVLILYTLKEKISIRIKKLLCSALVFCWFGDCLLLFPGTLFFLLGLTMFLIGHIFYIGLFLALRKKADPFPVRIWIIIFTAAYYITFMKVLAPHLGTMLIPVSVYGLVLCMMLLSAFHCRQKNNRASTFISSGALLFVLSDSLLAFDKFYSPLPYASVLIMLTYGSSQGLLVYGIIKQDSKRIE